MMIQNILCHFYRFGNQYPRVLEFLRFLMPTLLEKRLSKVLLEGGAGNITKKIVFQNGRYHSGTGRGRDSNGCNLIGYARGEFGLGEHLRYTTRSFRWAGIPFSLYNYGKTLHRQEDDSLSRFLRSDTPHKINLFCMNNGAVMELHAQKSDIFKDRYNIGYGFWELSDYPNDWLYAMNILDEIWAPSRYIQEVISEKSILPVVYMPMAVEFSLKRNNLRNMLGIGEDFFVFLFSLDFSSRIFRKNPKGVIEAFKKAFPEPDKPVLLIIKTKLVRSVKQQLEDYALLKKWVSGDKRIRLMNEILTKDQMLDLIYSCDAYVSLHRAEGFGLGMAEAMRLGKPVIATHYSGNTDFTRPENACLVDYRLKKVETDEYYFSGDSIWADPNVDQAADYMKKLAADSNFAKAIGSHAKAFMQKHHSFECVGRRYLNRLQLLGLL